MPRIKFWSNSFFLIPLAVAITNSIWWYVAVLGSVFIVSSYYHYHHEKRFGFLDVVSSNTLVLANFVLLFKSGWALPYSIWATICAIIALIFYYNKNKEKYDFNHGMWHIFSAAVSYFCLMTFL